MSDADQVAQALAELDPESGWYADVDLAAIAALDRIAASNLEHGGVLFKRKADGSYGYSTAVPGERERFTARARFHPDEYELAGLYHTHPGEDAAFFSPHDVDIAKQMRLPSFIKILEMGDVRRFTPGKTKTKSKRMSGLASARIAEGDPVQRRIQNIAAELSAVAQESK